MTTADSSPAALPGWHWLYFLLAGFDLLTVLLGLYLSHRIAGIYTDSIAANQQWAERVGRYDQLRRLAAAVNAPGNDVFDSHDVATERAAMQHARARFDAEIAAAKADLRSVPPGTANQLRGDLTAVEAAMDAMSEEAQLIFTYFEAGVTARAGERMATMDRKYDLVHQAFGRLNEHVRAIQAAHFENQTLAARTVQRFEGLIGSFVILMVAGATIYGHYLFKQAAAEARKREHDQRLRVILESEQQFRSLIEDGSDIIVMLDQDHTIRYASPSFARVLGHDGALGRPLAPFIHPDDLAALTERCRLAFDHPGSNVDLTCRIRHTDGSWRTVEVVGHAATHPSLGPAASARVILTARDVTERLRLEAERQAIAYRFADILNIAADAIIAVDQEQRIILFNRGAERIFGYRTDEIVGQSLDLLIPDASIEAHRDHVRGFAAGLDSARGMADRRPIVGRRKDGTLFPAEASISKLEHHGRMILTAILRDITERRRAEQALATSEQRYRGLVDNMHEMLAELSPDGTIRFVNRTMCALTGFEESDLLGSDFFSYIHPDDLAQTLQHCNRLRTYREPLRGCEYRFRRKDGGYLYVVTNGDPIYEPSGDLRSIVNVLFDLSARKQAEETIRRLAYYDTLTGLPNRPLLYDRLTQAIHHGERLHQPVTFVMMDLDHFKEINNTLGHHHGDLLLQQLATRLTALLRDSDSVARLGGDEFAVLLPNTDLVGALRVLEKIRSTLADPFTLDTLSITVEASLGVAVFPEHARTAAALIQRANVAMYSAKQTRSGQAVYAEEHDHYSQRRLALMSELRYAIEHGELTLHFQPKVEISTRCVVGVEALVRWRHPHRGMIAPDEFIPLAEQTGLMKPLTLWVLNCAREHAARWRQAGRQLTIAVNLSARILHDSALPSLVGSLLPTGLPSWLELEITESTIMDDPVRALEILKRLHAMGVPLAIDDFGTGYSSLGYLKRLPVTSIKIDKSFVKNMVGDDSDAVIVRSTIDLAHNLGLSVVAEGVETSEVWNRLADLGCDVIQGYYVCRPIPYEELERWFLESGWGISGNTASTRAQAA